jgi:hypothetical protein
MTMEALVSSAPELQNRQMQNRHTRVRILLTSMRYTTLWFAVLVVVASSCGSTTNKEAGGPVCVDGGTPSPSFVTDCLSGCGAGQVCWRDFFGAEDGGGDSPPRCIQMPVDCASTPTCDCIVRDLLCTIGGSQASCCVQGGEWVVNCFQG